MVYIIKTHLHPISGRLIYWNVVILILIKFVIPNSSFQSAALLESIPIFDSTEIVELTNKARTDRQLSSLAPNDLLDIAAADKLNDMAKHEYFAHNKPDGTAPWHWISRANYRYKAAGENLAIGFSTPEETVKAWLNSPPHKANLLNRNYKDIGVAVKGVRIGDLKGLLVVQMFGLPAPEISPPTLPAGQTKLAESVSGVVHYVSTEPEIESVTGPTVISRSRINNGAWPSVIEFWFIIYALAVLIFGTVSFLSMQRGKYSILKLSLHSAVFLLGLLLPEYQATINALIF